MIAAIPATKGVAIDVPVNTNMKRILYNREHFSDSTVFELRSRTRNRGKLMRLL